jgi:hypothetical protein
VLVGRRQCAAVPSISDIAKEPRQGVLDEHLGAEAERATLECRLEGGGIESFGCHCRVAHDGIDRDRRTPAVSLGASIDQRLQRGSLEARHFADAVSRRRRPL